MVYEIVQENTYEKIKKQINTLKVQKKKVIFMNDDDELSRKILEKLGDDIEIYLINQAFRRDKQKQREGGFNQVIAKICQKQTVSIGINLDEIIEARSIKDKSEFLGRVRQNIKLCNKNKIYMKFIVLKKENERNIYDLKSLGLILGMPTWMIKEL